MAGQGQCGALPAGAAGPLPQDRRRRSASPAPSRWRRARGWRTTSGCSMWRRKTPSSLARWATWSPASRNSRKQLERFHRNPLFRGIRYGNLWGRKFAEEAAKPEFIADLKLLARRGAGDGYGEPESGADRNHRADHRPCAPTACRAGPSAAGHSAAGCRRAARPTTPTCANSASVPQVYVKLSEILRRVDGKVIEDPAFYRARLDELYGIFGEDRVLYRQRLAEQRSVGAVPQGARDWCASISAARAAPRRKSISGRIRWRPIIGSNAKADSRRRVDRVYDANYDANQEPDMNRRQFLQASSSAVLAAELAAYADTPIPHG